MSNRVYAVEANGGWEGGPITAEIVSVAILKRTDKRLTVESGRANDYRTVAPLAAPQTAADAVAVFVAERMSAIARAQAEIDAARAALAAYREAP